FARERLQCFSRAERLALADLACHCGSRRCAIIDVDSTVIMEEREFYDEKEQQKAATLNCPHCRQAAEYELNWLVRTKKKQLPPRADERDRAKFAKARS